jgi:hypothetical protein
MLDTVSSTAGEDRGNRRRRKMNAISILRIQRLFSKTLVDGQRAESEKGEHATKPRCSKGAAALSRISGMAKAPKNTCRDLPPVSINRLK